MNCYSVLTWKHAYLSPWPSFRQSESSIQMVNGDEFFWVDMRPLLPTFSWFARADTPGNALTLTVKKTAKTNERIFILVEYRKQFFTLELLLIILLLSLNCTRYVRKDCMFIDWLKCFIILQPWNILQILTASVLKIDLLLFLFHKLLTLIVFILDLQKHE